MKKSRFTHFGHAIPALLAALLAGCGGNDDAPAPVATAPTPQAACADMPGKAGLAATTLATQ
ncbi:MAG: hypothetical protein JWP93_155, partial [Polaromonas sp.]|nr:hypothetical protein [Polaromonas sp.]